MKTDSMPKICELTVGQRAAALGKAQADKRKAGRNRIKARNEKRIAAKFARNFGERGAAIRLRPCRLRLLGREHLGEPCRGSTVAAHASARGMGGCKGDRRSLVELCVGHHTEQERGFQSFDRRYQIDCKAEAANVAAELDAQGYA